MSESATARAEIDHTTIAPPSWAQCLMAVAGILLLIEPALGVLWPR